MSILTLVHTCYAYRESRARLVHDTWGRSVNDFFFVCDNDDFKLGRSINLGPYPAGPTYHPHTLVKIWQLFESDRFSKFKWLFLVDDDSYVFSSRLSSFLEFFDPDATLILGDFLNWPSFHPDWARADYSFWIGGGSGIVFSRSAVQRLLSYSRRYNVPVCNHDVWIHRLINSSASSEIKKIHGPGFHQYGASSFLSKDGYTKKHLVSVHLNHDMQLIHEFHKLSLVDLI